MATVDIEWTNPVQGLLLLAHITTIGSIFEGEVHRERQKYWAGMGPKAFTVDLEGVTEEQAATTRENLLQFTHGAMESFDDLAAHRRVHALRFASGSYCGERHARSLSSLPAAALMAAMMLHLLPDAEVVVDDEAAGRCSVEIWVAPVPEADRQQLATILSFADEKLWTYMAEKMRNDVLEGAASLREGATSVRSVRSKNLN